MSEIWDRIRARSDDRYLIVGDSEVGKSFMADRLRTDYEIRYKAPSLIVDSKPEYAPGKDWHRNNPGWIGVKNLPNAVLVTDVDDLMRRLNDKVPRTYVVQGADEKDYPRLMAVTRAFYSLSRGHPRIIHVDETMDFFHANGMPKYGADILRQTARSSRARNCAVLYCAQRTKGFHPDIRTEMSKAAFFAMLSAEDRKLSKLFGIEMEWPTKDRWFQFWTKVTRTRTYGPYMLTKSKGT